MEYLKLEGTKKNDGVQLLAPHRTPKNQTINLRALSRCFIWAGKLGAPTTSPERLFQCLITLLVKNYFHITNLNLLCCSFMTLSLVLLLVTRIRRSEACMFLRRLPLASCWWPHMLSRFTSNDLRGSGSNYTNKLRSPQTLGLNKHFWIFRVPSTVLALIY